jgi:glycosyltransferase involved in cell wall biosynthesis
VVASPRPSTGGAAYEVDPLDTDSIADGLLTVATGEDERTRLAHRGRKRSSELRWSGIARRHLAVWERSRPATAGSRGG